MPRDMVLTVDIPFAVEILPRDYLKPIYVIDCNSKLWHGPVAPDNETMHWAYFGDALDLDGKPIWILGRSEIPEQAIEISEREAYLFISGIFKHDA